MPKWVKLILGLLLLPLCAGGGVALWRVLGASGDADTFWVALGGGAACWWVVFLMLPRPMLVYVFGHELTHALWTWLFGGSVKKFKATSRGGHVITDTSNFLIVLAPYFFPLYAVLVVLVFLAGDRLWDWTPHRVWFHFLLGAAYAFHLTLTWHVLQTSQTDITSQGWVFAAVIIFLGNLLVLMMAVPLLAGKPSLADAFQWWGRDTLWLVKQISRWTSGIGGL
jgi:hypothetical protein